MWISDQRRDEYLADDARNWPAPRLDAVGQIVFEGSAPSDLARNPCLARLRSGQKERFSGIPCWLGESVAIKDPTAALFRKQSGANLLMAGQNGETAFALMVAALVSLAAQQRQSASSNEPAKDDAKHEPAAQARDDGWATIYPFVAGTTLDEESEALLHKLPEVLPVRLMPQRELPELLMSLAEELGRRQKEGAGEPMFLFLSWPATAARSAPGRRRFRLQPPRRGEAEPGQAVHEPAA